MRPQRRPRRFTGQARHQLVGIGFEPVDDGGSGEVFGGGVEGVEVAGGGLAEPDRRIALLAVGGGGGAGGVVAGQDLFEQVDRGARPDGVGMDDAVRVPVADDLQIEMVGGSAAGQHRVQLLPRLGAGGQAVHGVGGDPLCAVHGGRIPQLHRGLHVAGGQPDGPPVLDVRERSGCRRGGRG